MTLAKVCPGCGAVTTTTWCDECKPKPAPKANPEDRGYDHRWRKLSERARRAQPWCSDCGTTDDLQADHSPEAWARKAAGKVIRLADIDVVCGPCNVKRGAARGETPRGVDPTGTPALKE